MRSLRHSIIAALVTIASRSAQSPFERAAASLPILLIRTPFNASQEFPDRQLPPAYRELAQDGYIFVMEDVRGRFHSGGTASRLRRSPLTRVSRSGD